MSPEIYLGPSNEPRMLDHYPPPVRDAFESIREAVEAIGMAKFHLRKGDRAEAIGELARAQRIQATAIQSLGGGR